MKESKKLVLNMNHAFLLDYTLRNFPRGKILDYGCGVGDIVGAGLASGLDIYGVETFFGGGHGVREAVEAAGLLGSRIYEIREHGTLPFPDHTFDLVYNDQVFEHVSDLSWTLQEINRVLKLDGVLLSLFPSQDVIREGHCGIPLSHRFPRDSRLGYCYILILRTLGMGKYHNNKTRRRWSRDFLEWLNTYCFYRTRSEIDIAFQKAHFSTINREIEYINFRLPRSRLALFAWALKLPYSESAWSWIFRKLGFMVLLSSKKQSCVSHNLRSTDHLSEQTSRSECSRIEA